MPAIETVTQVLEKAGNRDSSFRADQGAKTTTVAVAFPNNTFPNACKPKETNPELGGQIFAVKAKRPTQTFEDIFS